MKSTPLQRRTPLKTYTHLITRVSMKRSRFVQKMPDTPMAILDRIVSEVVRRVASINGIAVCVTCGAANYWKKMDCGHFQDRAHIATRFLYKNLGVQCHDCNRFNGGENEKFAEYIDATYGPGTADQLRALAQTIVTDFPFAEETAKWQAKLDALVAQQDMEIQY